MYQGTGSAPVAYIQEKKNNVEQKPYDRLIWKNSREGETVFRGDTIRTSNESKAEIVFTKSGTSIVLNENSQVVIEDRKGDLTINVLSGSLTAKGSGEAPIVVYENTVIRLEQQKTEVAIAVNKETGLDGCVYSGSVSMDSNTGKKKFNQGNCSDQKVIPIISPKPNSVIARTGKTGQTAFEFVGHDFEYVADLYIGTQAKTMNKVASIQGNTVKGTIYASPPEGAFYWQVVTRKADKDYARTQVSESEAITVVAPELFNPQQGAVFKSKADTLKLVLSWSTSPYAKQFHLQVSKDQNFTKDIVFEGNTDRNEITVTLPKNATYYWRVIASWKNPEFKDLSSQVRKFSIENSTVLVPPVPTLPREGEQFAMHTAHTTGGLNLSWTPVPDAKSYNIEAIWGDGKTTHHQTSEPFLNLKVRAEGKMKWAVQAMNSHDTSPWTPFLSVVILPEFPIKWKQPTQSEIESSSDKPQVKLEWSLFTGVESWTLEYQNINTHFKKTVSLKAHKLDLELPTLGNWRFQITGFDAKGNAIAKSELYPLRIVAPKILPAPVFLGASNFSLKGLEDGSMRLRWNSIGRASSYLIFFRPASGKETLITTQRTDHELTDLKEGIYFLQIVATDRDGKKGILSKPYKLSIPKDPGAPPPVIKKIVVY